MKITHHLSEELLLDYSSGALSEAWSIAVAAHLSKCSHCRAFTRQVRGNRGLTTNRFHA